MKIVLLDMKGVWLL